MLAYLRRENNMFLLYSAQYQTDVFGVYDRPPTEPDAVLLREIGERLILVCSNSFWVRVYLHSSLSYRMID